ncbi:hypothetical protein F5Y14DRAFT_448537 [Nemania sp. NC0429]|nr:hypothetical protein F5Y14DRAFT_448537 [Nemania sp. NC0429]
MALQTPRNLVVNASDLDNSSIVYIPAWIFLTLCPALVGLRIWSRKKTGSGVGADDYTIMLSLAFAIASDIVMMIACIHGYGKHESSLTEYQNYQSMKAFYILQITFKISMYLTKASILLLYLRIFGTVTWLRRTCKGLLWYIALFCTAVTLATIFQCTPISAAFDRSIKNANCIENRSFWYLSAVVSIVTDIVILCLPMRLVYHLHIRRDQKIAIMFVFALGGFAVLSSIFRVTSLELQYWSTDRSYEIASTMWTLIEMSLAIVCACLPPIQALLVKTILMLKSSYSKSVSKTISPAKLVRSPQPASDSEGRWGRMQPGSIQITTTCGPGSGSEIPTFHEDGTVNRDIRKTLEFRIEYSKCEEDSDVTDDSTV